MADEPAAESAEQLESAKLALELAANFIKRRPYAGLACAVGCGLVFNSLASAEERQYYRTRLGELLKAALNENVELRQALSEAEAFLTSQFTNATGGAEDVRANNGG